MTELQQKIFELRDKGLSYNEISKQLGCSKGTISYNLKKEQKEKTKERLRINNFQTIISKKIYRFKNKINKFSKKLISSKLQKRLLNKFLRFKKGNKPMFTYEQLIKKLKKNPTCYITGDKIDLTKTSTWNLDHKVPTSRGGDNSLENCGLATRRANLSKSDMTLEEYLEHCKKVLIYNGYEVIKG